MSNVFSKSLTGTLAYTSEEELLNDAYNGSSKAWGIIYNKISGYLFTACMRYSSSREQAEDFLQEGFVKAYSNIHSFKGTSSLQTWITRVVINNAINELRKTNKIKFSDIDEKITDTPEEDELIDNQPFDFEKVTEAMQQLPLGYRTVLNMYAIDNLSHNEIAETLGISTNTSKTQLFKARKMLIKLLEDKK